MRAYRYWKAEYASLLAESGQIRLMPLSYYRAIETPRPGVQDELEGTSVGVHEPMAFSMATATSEQHAVLSALGIRIEAAGSASVNLVDNRKLVVGPDVYILCLSADETAQLFDPADVVTLFPDVQRFALALLQASRDIFQSVQFGPVEYRNIRYSLEDGIVGPSPFVKGPEFAHQNEVRLVLEPRRPMSGPVVVESPLLIEALAAQVHGQN